MHRISEDLHMTGIDVAKRGSVLTTFAFALLSNNAFADDFDCRGVVGNRRIDSNIIVRDECTLDGTRVDGNIRVMRGALLRILRDARIDGNVQSDGADVVIVRDSHIKGDIQLEGIELDIVIDATEIIGNIQLKANGAQIRMAGNDVAGDVQAFENRGPVRIAGNTIGGNLQCKDNRKDPMGRSNSVKGNREDQCRRL